MVQRQWRWEEPMPGTQFYPHHYRWACRRSMIRAIEFRNIPHEAWRAIGEAEGRNAAMYDCGDPLAWAYKRRIGKIIEFLLKTEYV